MIVKVISNNCDSAPYSTLDQVCLSANFPGGTGTAGVCLSFGLGPFIINHMLGCILDSLRCI
eukprot:12930913-Prorocentrum_lima.AAC.1